MSYPPAYLPMPARGQEIAPKFVFDPLHPQELRRYFEDLAILFETSNVTQHQEKKCAARRYVDINTSDLWESLSEYQSPYSWDQFVAAVYKLYPGSEDDRRWSIADMEKLIGEQLRSGIPDVYSLGAYHRAFLAITQFLCSKHRLSRSEQSRAFIRGFQPSLWSRIAYCLELKYPDHYPDDPYPLSGIYEAAAQVLRRSMITAAPSALSTVPALTPAPRSKDIESEDLAACVDRCARKVIEALVPQEATPAHSHSTPLVEVYPYQTAHRTSDQHRASSLQPPRTSFHSYDTSYHPYRPYLAAHQFCNNTPKSYDT